MTGGDLYSNNNGLDVNNEPVTIDPDQQKQIDQLVSNGMDLSTAKAQVLNSSGPQQFSDTTGKLSNE